MQCHKCRRQRPRFEHLFHNFPFSSCSTSGDITVSGTVSSYHPNEPSSSEKLSFSCFSSVLILSTLINTDSGWVLEGVQSSSGQRVFEIPRLHVRRHLGRCPSHSVCLAEEGFVPPELPVSRQRVGDDLPRGARQHQLRRRHRPGALLQQRAQGELFTESIPERRRGQSRRVFVAPLTSRLDARRTNQMG